jgi:hypothetical protein
MMKDMIKTIGLMVTVLAALSVVDAEFGPRAATVCSIVALGLCIVWVIASDRSRTRPLSTIDDAQGAE